MLNSRVSKDGERLTCLIHAFYNQTWYDKLNSLQHRNTKDNPISCSKLHQNIADGKTSRFLWHARLLLPPGRSRYQFPFHYARSICMPWLARKVGHWWMPGWVHRKPVLLLPPDYNMPD